MLTLNNDENKLKLIFLFHTLYTFLSQYAYFHFPL